MTMDCTQIEQAKEAYVDGRLAPEMRAAVEAHAATCAACRQRLALAWRVQTGLGEAVKTTLGRPALGPARATALYNRVTSARAAALPPGLRRVALTVSVLALVLLTTGALVASNFGGHNPFDWTPNPQENVLPVPLVTVPPTIAVTRTTNVEPTWTPGHEDRKSVV